MLCPCFLPHAFCLVSVGVHLPPVYALVVILVLVLVFVPAVRFIEYEYDVHYQCRLVPHFTFALLSLH
jgi:hypothetical protein